MLYTVTLNTTIEKEDELYERLIFEIGTGDTKALEKLYMLTKSKVYGYALSILKNKQNAEDIMQDTYLKLFYAAKAYKPQGKPIAWIITIARNLSLTKYRKKDSNTYSIEDEYILPEIEDFSENSIDRMILTAAINKLADDERQIVMLHGVSGLKHREISEVLQIPLATVLSKYRRALAKLNKIMKEEKQ